MAESSYYWQGNAVGDAVLAPYDMDEFLALYLRTVFLEDPTVQAPIDGYANMLAPSNSGTTVYMATGAALVYGFVYENDAILSLSAAGAGYYRLVLRVLWGATQTVRAVLLSGGGGGLPALTQVPGTQYEVNLCDIHSTGAALDTFTDKRVFCRSNSYRMPRIHNRIGSNSSLDWNSIVDAHLYTPFQFPIATIHTTLMQTGSIEWSGGAATSGDVTVTFPTEFTYIPIVVLSQEEAVDVVFSTVATAADVTIYWKSSVAKTAIVFHWIAVGPKQRGL